MSERIQGPISVTVIRGGRSIKQIERPLHVSGNAKAVVFRGKLWPLQPGNQIIIDQAPVDPGKTLSRRQQPRAGKDAAASAAHHAQGTSAVDKNDPSEVDPADSAKNRSGTRRPAASAAPVASGDPAKRTAERWDARQLGVIEAPADARLLVDAGPGTGKTAVACRRVAWLIDQCGLAPSNVWLISFTRTAVKEIRNRIAQYLHDPADLWSVRIATLDSHAWAIQSGFDDKASLKGSYEENISRVRDMVRNHEGVFEYLAGLEHLLIDEAQDIVGVRADLLVDLVKRLSPACGVTVFADEAQAIYGFSEDDGDTDAEDGTAEVQGHLPARLRSPAVRGFRETSLSAIYRADTEQLRSLFTEVRRTVLAPVCEGKKDRLEQVTDMVRALADQEPAVLEELGGLSDGALRGTFVLFRRRIDALTAASFWGTAPHRIRMSGLATLIEPWLGALFWDWTAKRIKQPQFEGLWLERVEGKSLTDLSTFEAWELLVRTAGESPTSVSMDVARAKLGRSAPPSDFLRPDFGLGGPVFGTIHGCKGREADSVLLMMPASPRTDGDHDEEARVIFVGATRARAELRIGKGFPFLASRNVKGSGRAFALKTKKNKPHAQVEFGRQGDLSAADVAGRTLFSSADHVVKGQDWLLAHANEIVPAVGRAEPDNNWRYQITPKDGPALVYLSESVNSDLFSIGKTVREKLKWSGKLRPSYGPNHLKTFGACTVVLGPEDQDKGRLHEPWATSGFVLAPVIQGFDMIYFRAY